MGRTEVQMFQGIGQREKRKIRIPSGIYPGIGRLCGGFGECVEIPLAISKITFGGCFSQGFYSSTNIMTKKQVGEERVYSAYISIIC